MWGDNKEAKSIIRYNGKKPPKLFLFIILTKFLTSFNFNNFKIYVLSYCEIIRRREVLSDWNIISYKNGFKIVIILEFVWKTDVKNYCGVDSDWKFSCRLRIINICKGPLNLALYMFIQSRKKDFTTMWQFLLGNLGLKRR